MITRQEKQKIIEDLALKLSRQKAVVFSDFTGLKVNQMQNLRKKLRKEGIDFQFAKNESLKILAGLVNKEYFETGDMERLAKIPSREQLLAKLTGAISSPLSELINVLEGNLRNFIYLLKNLKPE